MKKEKTGKVTAPIRVEKDPAPLQFTSAARLVIGKMIALS